MIRIACLKNWNDFQIIKSCEWQVIDLKITCQEGHIAKATLQVANFALPELPYICMFENETILFQGTIASFIENNGYISNVELLCLAPNFEDDLKALIQRGKLDYSPLFFQGQTPKISDVLEASNKLFMWDKTTGSVSFSDYFKGAKTVDIGTNYIKKNLQIRQIKSPLKSAALCLKVHWLQHLEGSFNASTYIAKAFPGSVIASLTPEALQLTWPKDNQKLGGGKKQSGYKTLKSYLSPISGPPNMRLYTATFRSDDKKELPKRLKISYFKGYLRILWRYFQPRAEEFNLRAELNSQHNVLAKQQPLKIPISISLPNSAKAVFFETKEGLELLGYAKKVLKARLLASLRCIEVRCQIPWQIAKELSLDDSVSIDAAFLGKNKISGKLTSITMHAIDTNRFCEIKFACTLDDYPEPKNQDNITLQTYTTEQFLGDEITSNNKLEGITQPILLAKNLIESVMIKNNFLEQEAQLKAIHKNNSKAIDYVLADFATQVQINLKDLRSQKLLERKFTQAIHY